MLKMNLMLIFTSNTHYFSVVFSYSNLSFFYSGPTLYDPQSQRGHRIRVPSERKEYHGRKRTVRPLEKDHGQPTR